MAEKKSLHAKEDELIVHQKLEQQKQQLDNAAKLEAEE